MTSSRLKTILKAGILMLALLQIAQGQEPTQQRCSTLRIVAFEYPRLANLGRVQGRVELALRVKEDGSVASADVLSGVDLLRQAAQQALMRWRFHCPETAERKVKMFVVFELLSDKCTESNCQSEFQVDLPDAIVIRAKRLGPFID